LSIEDTFPFVKRIVDICFDEDCSFPHPLSVSGKYPLAIGGRLTSQRLLMAYAYGIFPWYEEGPIVWWFTNPRFVLFPEEFHISKNLKRTINKGGYVVTFNQSFKDVVSHCASVTRNGQSGTWINKDVQYAYIHLHEQGWAYSTEIRKDGRLIGGLYGMLLGKVFYGESMFSLESGASKLAFVATVEVLRKNGCVLIDCQQETEFLGSFGARMIPGEEFFSQLVLNRQESQISYG